YRAAAQIWWDNGVQVHGLALLAHDSAAQNVWFWNGFGLTVVDAIRSTDPLGIALPTDFAVRKATLDDIDVLAEMEVEHARHYTEPPVLMDVYKPADAAALAEFLSVPQNAIWLALDGKNYMGYLRFMADNEDSAAIVVAPDRIANTGAYIRPQYRGRKAAPAVLDTALRDYAAQGFKRCSVDFESFNPEAAVFWMRYFQPVCYSVTRIPERQPHVG
ncbi:MAG: GNAT family N-acetyltransferase, partial [Anaerolineae bacterium]|nr:GNAT family N-acetyltransferase [Anaerolineae bacterium]